MVSVIMKNQEFAFKKIVRSDFPITLIVKSDKPAVKSKILNIRYDEISDFTVSNLYWVYFLAQEERKAFEAETR